MTSPVQRTHYETSDAEEGAELLRSLYTEHTPLFSGSSRRYRLELDSAAVESDHGRLSVERMRNSMRVDALAEPLSSLIVCVVTSGYGGYRLGREQTGPLFLSPHWLPAEVAWEDFTGVFGALDLDGVRRVAGGLSGLDPNAVLFTSMLPRSAAAARYMASVLAHVESSLHSSSEAMTSPLLRGEAFRQLATAAVLTFPNTALDHLNDPSAPAPGSTEPATVRRAVEFMDANAHRDIDITQIADAARIGPRALQMAFRRHRNQTPLEYLRGVRMEGAHRDLEAGDPTRGDTVAAIAARWGFTHPGRFSVEYRRTYGCSPSETLRR